MSGPAVPQLPYRTRRRWLLPAVSGLVVVLLVSAAACIWTWTIRPRQLIEVHDNTERITVQVPRAWTAEVEGRTPQNRQAYLLLGKYEERHLQISVLDTPGSIDLGKQCGLEPEDVLYNAPSNATQIWAYRNCPEGQTTFWMQKIIDKRITVVAEVRDDDEQTARKVLDSITVKLP